MERIDFLECTQDSERRLPSESASFHSKMNQPVHYPHHDLQKAVGLHEEILRGVPSATSIIDIGAGPRSLFDPQKIYERDIHLLGIDFDPMIPLDHALPHTMIRTDLNAIPQDFFQQKTLIDALDRIVDYGSSTALFERTCRLVAILQKPISTILFSHVLLYLRPKRVGELLQLALRSLPEGGSLRLMDKCKWQFEGTQEYEQGKDQLAGGE